MYNFKTETNYNIMTTEEKAKAYDEAIKKAKDMLSYKEVRQEDIEYLFPELKGNEDEKMRRAILELVKQSSEILERKNQEQMIAWLEKQARKPTIFIPKFRVGDKLVSTNNPRLTYEVFEVGHINQLGEPEYQVEIFTDGKAENPRNIRYIVCYRVDEWAKLIEQKPAWSEDDERVIDDAVYYLEHYNSSIQGEFNKQYIWAVINKLRSLKSQKQ